MTSNAPGKAHRDGLSLMDALRMFPDDATAESWFTAKRWPDGPHCPHCGSTDVLSGAAHKTMPYRCREKECRKRFSVRTGTVMDSSNIGYQKWALALYLFATNLKGVSSMKLHRDLGVTQKSAWFMAHRIREAWKGRDRLFSGPVEVDETFIGGRRRNMHKDKRKELAVLGRGAVGKAVVAGALDRASNRIAAHTDQNREKDTLQGFVREHADPAATVYTDDAGAYRGLPFRHAAVNHAAGEYVRGDAHTNGIESFWAMLKRAYKGTFHKISPKHLDRYVAEFASRHNVRDLDTIDQMGNIAAGMAGKRLTYRNLIADPDRLSAAQYLNILRRHRLA